MEPSRKFCPSCGQQLAHAAYYRHIRDDTGSVCPGKSSVRQPASSTHHDDLDASFSSISNCSDTDSSFDFGSALGHSSDLECGSEGGDVLHSDSESTSDSTLSTSMSLESAEEIWETSNSEEDESCDSEASGGEGKQAQAILFAVSLFLNFFQLTFRISEQAMTTLLKFLRAMMLCLSNFSPKNSLLFALAKRIPKSLYSIRKLAKQNRDGITEYVVCPKCHHLYELEHCIIINHGRQESKNCDSVLFPNHPHVSKRSKCNAPLMKWVRIGGKSKLVPRKTFLYHSVISGLNKLIARKGFLQMCEYWRNFRSMTPNGMYTDVYDGKIWKELCFINERPFLESPRNLCLSLNIDWFNPFAETQYSVGAIYLVVQNLPRSYRFKAENIILIGLIPGPKEPPKTVNTYLEPLVNDLLKLYTGVNMSNPHSFCGSSFVRAVLSCVICDMPATRKVCGFLGINAVKKCTKCLKEFETSSFGSKPNYSGYDMESWQPRDMVSHLKIVSMATAAQTATERAQIEKSHGARYSDLLRLPYFNVIRYHVVDPMHNLFLGIAKHTMNTWKELNIITLADFVKLQIKIDSIIPPPKIGRIPRKLGSGFSSLTADEWKNWILLYSTYCLRDILPEPDYLCWCLFVDACYLLCQLVITDAEVRNAHDLLVRFCKRFENLYGFQRCTPNMHMACHLHNNIQDYGPLTAFWAFSFERYNGALERINISWCGPEKQMFKKFLDLQSLSSTDTLSDDDIMKSMFYEVRGKMPSSDFSSVSQMKVDTSFLLQQSSYLTCPVKFIDATDNAHYKLLPPLTERCFNDIEMQLITVMYDLLYPEHSITNISRFYLESKRLLINDEEFISTKARSQRSSTVAAHWPSVMGIDSLGEAPVRIGISSSFIRHTVTIKDTISDTSKTAVHVLARVKWLEDHPCRDHFHQSIIVSATTYDLDSPAIFIPVSRIIARCATIHNCTYRFEHGEDRVCISIPLVKKIY